MNRRNWRLRSLTFVLVTAMFATLSGAFVGQECCISLFGRSFCGADGQDTPPGAGGIGQSTPTPPPPPHQWVLLPGCCDFFFNQGGGSADHHDGGPGSHAVDIDINGAYCNVQTHECTPNCGGTCPDVYYHDRSNSVSARNEETFDWSCSSHMGGGQHVEFTLYSLDPPDEDVGFVRYLHLMDAVPSGTTITDGSRVATVAALAGWECWTGPHLHQEITRDPVGAPTPTHMTEQGQNCAGGGPANPNAPCYSISW